jgi:4-aminobutyrate aminotransferase/(S)-3-amino-2-methylpropionate transaminase
MASNAELMQRRAAAVVRGVSNVHSMFLARALNAELWDEEGRRYVDFASGIAVVNTGHNHPKVIAAVEAQLKRFTHGCFQVTPYESYVALAEQLNQLAPGTTPKKTLFLTTGAEAVENAIKIARAATGRSAVIAFTGGFHGRTLMSLALTGKVMPYKTGFGPFPGEVFHAPFPIPYHGIDSADSLKAIDALFKADVDPTRVAAMIVEPVLGEGGFYIAPPEFLQALRRLCDAHGIVLIADEIQTGFARTGRLFAVEYAGIEPDLMTLAKSLAGGFPLAAVVGREEIMDAPAPGGLGGTYAGSPLACAAGLAVLELIREENLCARAQHIGDIIVSRLQEMAMKLRCIGEVRALGAMVAMELVKDHESREADADLTRALVQEAAKRGLVILPCGIRSNVIRFLAPLTAPDAIVKEGMDILEAALAALIA